MDPDSPVNNSFTFFSWSPNPELRLFEKQEIELRRMEAEMHTSSSSPHDLDQPVPVTLDQDNGDVVDCDAMYNDPDYFRVYHVYRFFRTIEGFLQGSLDLTGRHQRRLDGLIPLWLNFFKEFFTLKESARVSLTKEKIEGQAQEVVSYEVEHDAWTEFRVKWKIPRIFSFNHLTEHADYIIDLGFGRKEWKVQKLCLLDLPNELLDHISYLASLDQYRPGAIFLSATCKRMYYLGRPHLFESLSLNLQLPHDRRFKTLLDAGTDPTKDYDAIYSDISRLALENFFDKSAFIRSRPDLAKRTKKLSFRNWWRIEMCKHYLQYIDRAAFTHISSAFTETLHAVNNLQILHVSQLDLTPDFAISLSQLPLLREVSLDECVQTEDLTRVLMSDQWARCNQVHFLELNAHSIDEFEHSYMLSWIILLLFPNLSTFNCMNPSHECLVHPSLPDFFLAPASLEMLTNLRYLFLSHFHDISTLADMIRVNVTTFGADYRLPLTHLKIHSCWAQPDSVIIDLLEVLHAASAPLEVLVLDGLQDAELGLFEHIAEYFPDLLELTLIRRQNSRQHEAKQCSWLHPSWEYAPIFSRFNRLRHFGWNFCFMAHHLPTMMLVFERQVELSRTPGLSTLELEELLANDVELRELEDEADWDWNILCGHVAKLFGAYCPTLEAFEDIPKDRFEKVCLSRHESDGISLYIKNRFQHSTRWNPRLRRKWTSRGAST
ncbi:hypothetical protein BT96DRAFT_918914 [Gymnopus androsaceus JB14]|uniref:F-box domain-containing protein n=1 Tax=Gymnopus androsaceus JB14 TaxID=1447944 RepID=A0A6A4HTR1_9AGAR|nr:hypothetical protein BT96DRAFT_918914 [Gymnopus androsaceus JB14]